MSIQTKHLKRILDRSIEAVVDEVRNGITLTAIYPSLGKIHPAEGRERQIQHVVFSAMRSSGYFSLVETNYSKPRDNSRRIDIAAWLPDLSRWLFLEVKPCNPLSGFENVIADAGKLISDDPLATEDRLRGIFVYGFRDTVSRDQFPQKYSKMSARLCQLGFTEIGISKRDLSGTSYNYVQAGLWVIADARHESDTK